MNDKRGLYAKYHVRRASTGRPVTGCVVLEFGDPKAWPALRLWADTVEADGNPILAEDVRQALTEIQAEIRGETGQ